MPTCGWHGTVWAGVGVPSGEEITGTGCPPGQEEGDVLLWLKQGLGKTGHQQNTVTKATMARHAPHTHQRPLTHRVPSTNSSPRTPGAEVRTTRYHGPHLGACGPDSTLQQKCWCALSRAIKPVLSSPAWETKCPMSP
jgi:hypothetical protein